MISSGLIPSAIRFRMRETVTRIPRMQARPPIIWGSKVMRGNVVMTDSVYTESRRRAKAGRGGKAVCRVDVSPRRLPPLRALELHHLELALGVPCPQNLFVELSH